MLALSPRRGVAAGLARVNHSDMPALLVEDHICEKVKDNHIST